MTILPYLGPAETGAGLVEVVKPEAASKTSAAGYYFTVSPVV
jgi:hypothetical protein